MDTRTVLRRYINMLLKEYDVKRESRPLNSIADCESAIFEIFAKINEKKFFQWHEKVQSQIKSLNTEVTSLKLEITSKNKKIKKLEKELEETRSNYTRIVKDEMIHKQKYAALKRKYIEQNEKLLKFYEGGEK